MATVLHNTGCVSVCVCVRKREKTNTRWGGVRAPEDDRQFPESRVSRCDEHNLEAAFSPGQGSCWRTDV